MYDMPKKIWRPLRLNYFCASSLQGNVWRTACGYGGRHIPSKLIQDEGMAPYYVKHRIWSGNVCLLYALSFMHKKNQIITVAQQAKSVLKML